ncbi:unnamed protein product [Calypogeia fissa]
MSATIAQCASMARLYRSINLRKQFPIWTHQSAKKCATSRDGFVLPSRAQNGSKSRGRLQVKTSPIAIRSGQMERITC